MFSCRGGLTWRDQGGDTCGFESGWFSGVTDSVRGIFTVELDVSLGRLL